MGKNCQTVRFQPKGKPEQQGHFADAFYHSPAEADSSSQGLSIFPPPFVLYTARFEIFRHLFPPLFCVLRLVYCYLAKITYNNHHTSSREIIHVLRKQCI